MQQQQVKKVSTMWGRMVLMCLAMAILMPSLAQAARPKVMIVPFYTEEGRTFKEVDPDLQDFYRDVVGYVGSHLSRNCFTVANQWANDAMVRRSDWLQSRPREFSSRSIGQVAQRYGLSGVYVVRVKVFKRTSTDGIVVLRGIVRGDGYDAAGNSLGLPIKEKFSVSSRYREEAMIDLATELGDILGAELDASPNGDCGNLYYALTRDNSRRPGVNAAIADSVTVSVSGVRNSETIEALGKILNTSTGVRKNSRDRVEKITSEVHRDNTMMSRTIWQIELGREMSQQVLQANIIKNAKDIVKAGGKAISKGIRYRYDYNTIRELSGLTVGDNYAKGNLSFQIDRNKMRSWERSHRRR